MTGGGYGPRGLSNLLLIVDVELIERFIKVLELQQP